jgi:hypothetical protein
MPDANELERHTTRGRRNPELAAAMLEDEEAESLDDYGGGPGDEVVFVGLVEGDTIVAKAAFSGDNPIGGETWTTFGATTRQLPNESTDDAVARLRDVVGTEAIELAQDINGRLNEVREQARQATRSTRIQPRQQ